MAVGLGIIRNTFICATLLGSFSATAAVCPVVGNDTDCGIVITVTDTGISISTTGQGTYDGVEDTLVGVVNNSHKTIPALKLTSSTTIFSFDGDGLTAYGIPGNSRDATGYGGPNAYFTNINAAQTVGNVNFLTPIAPGGTAFFALEEALTASTSLNAGPPVQIVDSNIGTPSALAVDHFDGSFFSVSRGDPTPRVFNGRSLSFVMSPNIRGGFATSISSYDPLGASGASPRAAQVWNNWNNSSQNGPVYMNFDDTAPMDDPNAASGAFDMSSGDDTAQILDSFDNSSGDYGGGAGGGDNTDVMCCGVGEPINSATGNLFETQHDYQGAGLLPLHFARFYNSFIQVTDLASTELGTGWRGTYDSHITTIQGQSVPTVRMVRPNGLSLLFTNSGGQWIPTDATTTARLSGITDSTGTITGWQYQTRADIVETYDASGRLISLTNRNGLTQTLAYDAAGNLSTVTDPYGRQLTFGYDVQNRLILMTNPAGAQYHFAYDGNNNLISATYPTGGVRQYLYENTSFPNALTGIVDENGSRFVTWSYDGQGRAVSSVRGGGVQAASLTFNNNGTTTVLDANGATRVHAFTQNIAGTLKQTAVNASCTGCASVANTANYDNNGYLNSLTDPNGNTTSYTYDARGLLESRTDAVGTSLARAVSITWNSQFHQPLQITYPDRTITFAYDANGNRTQKTVTSGTTIRTWTYTYSSQGLLTSVVGPRTDLQQTIQYTYDTQGRLIRVTNALGQVIQFTSYDVQGRPLTIIDPNGVTRQFTYDAMGRVLTRNVGGHAWVYQYDLSGQLAQVTYPNGSHASFTYDAAHRLTDVTDTSGSRAHRALDAGGNTLKVQLFAADGTVVHQRTLAFDGYGRVTRSTDENQQITTFSHTNNGNITGVVDALGHASSASYDALNRIVAVTDAAGNLTTRTFDLHSHLLSVTAPNGAVTQYTYNGMGQLTQETSPDRGTTQYSYSNVGLLLTRTNALGVVTTLTYDALDRPTSIAYSTVALPPTAMTWLLPFGSSILSDNVTLTYDQGTGCTFGVGRLCARQDQTGTTRYAFDNQGNIVTQADIEYGLTYTTQYSYDAANQLIKETYPDGRVVNYARDSLERLTNIQATINGVSSPMLSALQYGADGVITGLTFGNGLTDARTYDPVGRLIQQVIGTADNRTYSYDAVGNMLSKQISGESDQFAYDALNRLTTESRAQSSILHTNGFAYDADGNRLSETLDGVTAALRYTPNSNRLIQQGSATITLDAAGNTVSDGNGARMFYYSPAGRLQWVSQNGVPVAGYLYNGLGQRTGKQTLLGISLYHYDIFGRLIDDTTIGGQPSRDYVYAGSTPVAQINHWVPQLGMLTLAHCQIGSDGLIDWVTFLHTDRLGTPRLGTDVSKNVVWRWDGEAFGETAPSQTVPFGAFPVLVNLRNPGQYFDSETNLFYNRARYYNPQTGRYLTSDPIGLNGGINTYAYVKGNPLRFIDRLGLDCSCPGASATGQQMCDAYDKWQTALQNKDAANAEGKSGEASDYSDTVDIQQERYSRLNAQGDSADPYSPEEAASLARLQSQIDDAVNKSIQDFTNNPPDLNISNDDNSD